MKNLSKKLTFHYFVLIFSVIFLFLMTFNNYQENRINEITAQDKVEQKQIAPEALFNECWLLVKNNYYLKDLNKQDWSKWKKRYKGKIKDDEDANLAINSMISSLNDPYSRFLGKDEFDYQTRAINSKLYGIGINIASISGKIYIVNVLNDAPAYNQGIRAGDIILKVNGVDIQGESIYQVAQKIRGDLSANIELELYRDNHKITKNIKRQEIKIKTVEYKNLTPDIGYIRISSFIGINSAKDFIIALNRLKDTNSLILDLRGNSGGLFQNAIIVSNLFLKKGVIVEVIARHNKKNIYSAKKEGCIYDKKLVVLVDEDSASASEIVAAALKDNKRAVLIGTKTFGKGLVQKVYELPNKSGMNLTIARYLTPSLKDINKKGVDVDYNVTISHNDLINNNDTQLEYAKNYLEGQVR